MFRTLSTSRSNPKQRCDTDYWVDLKKYITQGAQEQAEAALAKVVVNDGVAQPTPDVAKYRKLMVLASIEDWNLTDDSEKILPINLQSVQRLPMPVFDALWSQVQKNNSEAERSSDEQLDFRQ